jgi:hypothetical protein
MGINRDLGDRWAIAYLLEDLGILAALTGSAERAVMLVGAATSLRTAIGAPLPPADRTRLDELIAPARQTLGSAAETCEHRGRTMTADEAIRFGLEQQATT